MLLLTHRLVSAELASSHDHAAGCKLLKSGPPLESMTPSSAPSSRSKVLSPCCPVTPPPFLPSFLPCLSPLTDSTGFAGEHEASSSPTAAIYIMTTNCQREKRSVYDDATSAASRKERQMWTVFSQDLSTLHTCNHMLSHHASNMNRPRHLSFLPT